MFWYQLFTTKTPFYIACWNEKIEIVKLLLKDERVDINKSNNDDQTPLFIACFFGNLEIVESILRSGREINFMQKNKYGETALDIVRERKSKMEIGKKTIEFQTRKKNYEKIIKLIEPFERRIV